MGVLVALTAATGQATYTLLIIPALGAAPVARFRSFTGCVLAGLGLGMLGLVLSKATSDFSRFPQVGIQDGAALISILAIKVIGGQSLPRGGARATLRDPVAYPPRNVVRRTVLLTAAAAIIVLATYGGARFAVIGSLIGVVLALSIVMVPSFAGQISLCRHSFAGIWDSPVEVRVRPWHSVPNRASS